MKESYGEGGINEERREVGGREKKSNNGVESVERGRRGTVVKVGERRGRGVKRWHQPQLVVALHTTEHCCYAISCSVAYQRALLLSGAN